MLMEQREVNGFSDANNWEDRSLDTAMISLTLVHAEYRQDYFLFFSSLIIFLTRSTHSRSFWHPFTRALKLIRLHYIPV